MKTCPHCGSHNVPSSLRCFVCGAPLEGSETLDLKAPRARRKRHGEPYRAVGAAKRLLTALSPRGYSREGAQRKSAAPHHEVWLATLLGVIPGLGQIYNRQGKRGAVLFSLFFLSVALAAMNIYNSASQWFAIGALLVVLYSIQDAYGAAKLVKGEVWTIWKSLAVLFYFVFFVSTTAALSQMSVLPLVRIVHISHDALAPTFRKGDYVLVDTATPWFRQPRLGEIVFYRPTRGFAMLCRTPQHSEPTEYFIRPRSMFERVVGFPQDIIEKRGGTLYLNGERLEKACRPLIGKDVVERVEDFSLEVPRDYYGILLSAVAGGETAIYRFSPTPAEKCQGQQMSSETVQESDARAPIEGSVVLENWLEACLVKKGDILGRPIAIVYPPKRRGVVH